MLGDIIWHYCIYELVVLGRHGGARSSCRSYPESCLDHECNTSTLRCMLWLLHCGFFIVTSSLWLLHCDFFIVTPSLWLLHCDFFIVTSSKANVFRLVKNRTWHFDFLFISELLCSTLFFILSDNHSLLHSPLSVEGEGLRAVEARIGWWVELDGKGGIWTLRWFGFGQRGHGQRITRFWVREADMFSIMLRFWPECSWIRHVIPTCHNARAQIIDANVEKLFAATRTWGWSWWLLDSLPS
jgi:hypothetical protein